MGVSVLVAASRTGIMWIIGSVLWVLLVLVLLFPHHGAYAKANLTPVADPFESATTRVGALKVNALPVLLLYDPTRASELSVFRGPAQRFIQLARAQRPKFNAMSSREKIQYLENYVFGLCNKRIVNGLQVAFTMETGADSFCGYQPGMLSCFAADTCDDAAQDEAVKYIKAALARYDKFIRWSERRKWQYRGDALKVAFYTRNMPGRHANTCAMLKLINDNPEPVIVNIRGSVRSSDGQTNAVFGKPYYVAAKSALPNLSDEDLFNKDTEARLRSLTSEVLALSKRLSIPDLQAYTGTHERWNCFASGNSNGSASQAVVQQVVVEFPNRF